jgi:hypothetical protein
MRLKKFSSFLNKLFIHFQDTITLHEEFCGSNKSRNRLNEKLKKSQKFYLYNFKPGAFAIDEHKNFISDTQSDKIFNDSVKNQNKFLKTKIIVLKPTDILSNL